SSRSDGVRDSSTAPEKSGTPQLVCCQPSASSRRVSAPPLRSEIAVFPIHRCGGLPDPGNTAPKVIAARLRSLRQVKKRILLRRIAVLAVPPAAPQRLEQRCSVGKAIGLCLDAREQRLQVGLLRVEDQDIIDVTEFQAPPRDGEAAVGGVFGG